MCTLFLPPQTPPQAPPAATNPYHCIALKSHLFLDLVFHRFFLRFGLHLGGQDGAKTAKKHKKWVFKSDVVFLSLFCSILAPSWTGRTLKNHSFIAVKPIFLLIRPLALEPLPGPVFASKNHPKIALESTPSVKKRVPKRTSKTMPNYDGIFIDFASQNGAQNLGGYHHFASLKGYLAPSWPQVVTFSDFDPILASLGRLLALSWEGFGPILAPSGPILGRFFEILERFGQIFGGFWGQSSSNSPAWRNARSG